MPSTLLDSQSITLPADTTANRPTADAGMIRYNTTINNVEYYNGSQWITLDMPPSYTSISPSTFSTVPTTITITGTNFQTGVNVVVFGKTGSVYIPNSVTRVSSTSITFATTAAMTVGESPFDILITNSNGMSNKSFDVLTRT
jgi:hypothetical protein